MHVTFRKIRDKSSIDSSFLIAPDGWHIGESVSVLFDVSSEQLEAINNHPDLLAIRDITDPTKGAVHIPCVVVKRHHSIVFARTGRFNPLSESATLEAVSALWEDVLLWVLLGQKPEWATN